LHKIHDELNKILVRENRMKLYKEALKYLKVRVDLDLFQIREDVWGH
jgi:ribonuclease D